MNELKSKLESIEQPPEVEDTAIINPEAEEIKTELLEEQIELNRDIENLQN